MRVAHITDLHVEHLPDLTELFNKRLMGAVNLYLLGRSRHFSRVSQEALVRAVVEAAPDQVVCTGDLTATATETEFQMAKELLSPLLQRFPFFTIPGNHDVYTAESVGRFQHHFGNYAGESREIEEMEWLTLDVCHPDWMSRGVAGDALTTLEKRLMEGDKPAVVMLHYPLRNRRGEVYGPFTRALSDASEVEKVVRHPRVRAVLHGHEHHGYRTIIPREGEELPSLNPGASGYAFLPHRKRTAHFNVMEWDGGELRQVERYAFDGERFVAESGGAYATGG